MHSHSIHPVSARRSELPVIDSVASSSAGPVYRVYSFGKTATGTECEPAEVLRVHGDAIIDVQAGNLSSLALTASGRVFAWGCGKHGRLGLGDEVTKEAPQILPLADIESIAASNWFSLFICRKSGELLRCGRFGGVSKLTPEPVPELEGMRVSAAAAGDNCLAAVVDGAVVIVAGSAAVLESIAQVYRGGAESRRSLSPELIASTGASVRIAFPSAVLSVALRGHSFVAICTDGHAYAWGANPSSCLGVPVRSHVRAAARRAHGLKGAASVHIRGAVGSESPVWPPERILLPSGAASLTVASVSTGHINVHSLFLSASGAVIAAGSNYKFKTGIASASTRRNNTHSCECLAPSIVPGLTSGVVQVAAAALHSVAIQADGTVFLWGCGSDGRLGFPEYRARRARYLYGEVAPRRLAFPAGERAFRAHAFWYHTLVVTVDKR